MSTVTNDVRPEHPTGSVSPDTALVGGLLLITAISIGALLWIALASGPEISSIAPVAIPAISGITVAAISAIAVVLRKRPPRRSRRS